MPRIRRWHPVSHDFVRDREVQELRRKFGHWMSDVWLEMLSEADRNHGLVKGDRRSIAESLTWVSLSIKPSYYIQTVLKAIEYMVDKEWIIEAEGGFLTRNYAEYHATRGKKESQEGVKEAPSLLPSLTSLTNKHKNKDLSSDPKPPGSSVPPLDPHLQSWLQDSMHLQPLSNGKHGKLWKALERAYDQYSWLYFQDEINKMDAWMEANPNKKPTERGMPRFVRSWFERAVERGRKTHA